MPRLKVFRAHLGFYDSIVAVTSQKAALAAWGARPSEFAQGFAAETTDPQAVEAALAEPGVVLKRAYGSKGAFKREADPPAAPKPDKRAAAAAAKKRREKATAEARARKEEAKRRAEAAKAELRELADEEKALAARKRALRRKLRGAA